MSKYADGESPFLDLPGREIFGAYLQTLELEGHPTVQGVLVLHPGGGAIGMTSRHRGDNAFGAWSLTGSRSFIFQLIDFTFDDWGKPTGHHLITGHGTLANDQTIEGQFSVQEVDIQGNITKLGTGKHCGQRIDPMHSTD